MTIPAEFSGLKIGDPIRVDHACLDRDGKDGRVVAITDEGATVDFGEECTREHTQEPPLPAVEDYEWDTLRPIHEMGPDDQEVSYAYWRTTQQDAFLSTLKNSEDGMRLWRYWYDRADVRYFADEWDAETLIEAIGYNPRSAGEEAAFLDY